MICAAIPWCAVLGVKVTLCKSVKLSSLCTTSSVLGFLHFHPLSPVIFPIISKLAAAQFVISHVYVRILHTAYTYTYILTYIHLVPLRIMALCVSRHIYVDSNFIK